MAICPSDRPCATPTPSQAKASPSRTGNPRQTPQHRSQTHKTRGFGKAAGIKQRRFPRSCRGRAGDNPEQETLPSKTARSGSAHCCKQSFQEKKTNPFWAEKCLEYKSCTWLSPLPSPRPKMISGESRTVQCVCTDKQTLLHQGTDSRSPLVSGMRTGQKGQRWHSHSCAESLLLNRPPVPKDPLIHHPSALKFIQMILFIIN